MVDGSFLRGGSESDPVDRCPAERMAMKIHAPVDAEGRPVRLIVTQGHTGDAPVAAELLTDRAYDANALRDLAAERGSWANIPPRGTRKDAFRFSLWVCRQRDLVERLFNGFNQFRGLAARWDRRADTRLAGLKLAVIRI